MVVLDRLASAEQWQIRSLLKTNRDPRFFGVFLHNLTCGASMCAWPVGAVNAGNPRAAYDEAVGFYSPQTFSFGLEQGAVMAAAIAEACAVDATPQSVVAAALSVAKDASRRMIETAMAALTPGADRDQDLPAVHAAVQPWHHKQHHITDHAEAAMDSVSPPSNNAIESRLHTCEEVAVALAMLFRAEGDFMETVCAAAEYGEDADSIAAMAGSLAGALGGLESIPAVHRTYADRQNRRNFLAASATFAEVIQAIAAEDAVRDARRRRSLAAL
jgi:ADP-ribosylglycohydrolase